MSNLISELLEFRKLEQNHKTLQISQQDITPFLKEICVISIMTFNYQKLPHYVGLTANYLKKYSSIYYPMPLNIHPTMGILSYPAVQQIMK